MACAGPVCRDGEGALGIFLFSCHSLWAVHPMPRATQGLPVEPQRKTFFLNKGNQSVCTHVFSWAFITVYFMGMMPYPKTAETTGPMRTTGGHSLGMPEVLEFAMSQPSSSSTLKGLWVRPIRSNVTFSVFLFGNKSTTNFQSSARMRYTE